MDKETVWESDIRGDALRPPPFPLSHVCTFSFVKFPPGPQSLIQPQLINGGWGCELCGLKGFLYVTIRLEMTGPDKSPQDHLSSLQCNLNNITVRMRPGEHNHMETKSSKKTNDIS